MHFFSKLLICGQERKRQAVFIDASHAKTSCSSVAVHCNGFISNIRSTPCTLCLGTPYRASCILWMHRAFTWLPSSTVSGSVRSFLYEARHKIGGWAKSYLRISGGVVDAATLPIYCSALLELLLFSGLEDQPLRRHDRTGEKFVPRDSAVILSLPSATNNSEAGSTEIQGLKCRLARAVMSGWLGRMV